VPRAVRGAERAGPAPCWLHAGRGNLFILLPGLDLLLLFVLLQLAFHAIMGDGGRERRPDSWIDSIGLLLLRGAPLSLPPVVMLHKAQTI
jgi:hypothetical protein